MFCQKFLFLILLSAVFLVGILVFRAEFYFSNRIISPTCRETHEPIKGKELIQRFSQALQFKTITKDVGVYDTVELKKFANFLKKSFPKIHSSPFIDFETVNEYSLLYHVKGNDTSLKPYLLCSHIDVVPVEIKKWKIDPFSGTIINNEINGRGAIDVKDTLMAIMESLEYLLTVGFHFKRSFYIAFGHDEEGLGFHGAAEIARVFQKKGIKEFEYLLDEGTFVLKDMFPGIKNEVALVGVSEKGFLTLKLKSQGEEGHSSLANQETAITILAKAVSKLTGDSHKSFFGYGPEKSMFEEFAFHSSYPYKLLYSNLWFFNPILSSVLSKKPSSNALVRTTSAVTVIKGGFKENVLPTEAEALVNHRIHPMQTIKDVIEYDRQLINDNRIEIEIKNDPIPPHPLSPHDKESFGYQTIKKSIEQVFENVVVIPGIMIASTDTRWYMSFTKSIYRFSPVLLKENETKRFHGHNEKISTDNYLKIVNFYHHIITNSDKNQLDQTKILKDEL